MKVFVIVVVIVVVLALAVMAVRDQAHQDAKYGAMEPDDADINNRF